MSYATKTLRSELAQAQKLLRSYEQHRAAAMRSGADMARHKGCCDNASTRTLRRHVRELTDAIERLESEDAHARSAHRFAKEHPSPYVATPDDLPADFGRIK